jgi:hypothetical protein
VFPGRYKLKFCILFGRNEHVRSIGKEEARHRKYKGLELGGGQAYDRSSDCAAVVA